MKRKLHQQPSVKESQIKKQKITHEPGSFINKQQKQREKQVGDESKTSWSSTGASGSSRNGKFPIKHSKQTHGSNKTDKITTQNEKIPGKKYKEKNINKLKKGHFKRKTKKYTKKRNEHTSKGDKCNKDSVCEIDSAVKSSVQSTDMTTLKHPNRQSGQKSSKEQSEKGQMAATNKQATLPASSTGFSSNWKQFCLAEGISSKKKHKKSSSDEHGKSKPEENKSPEIWFDDVDEILLEHESGKDTDVKSDSKQSSLVKLGSYSGHTKVVAMDCEMVGVGDHGSDNMLARVSIVNQYGNCVYDTFVKPVEQVVDYRTHVSGVRKSDVETGKEFTIVQKEVADILTGRILVGHALHNDLQVLYLSHPKKNIRDTSRFKPFRQLFNGKNPSLKKLSAKVLHVNVQEGEHSSVQDAQATMRLYTMYKKQWEKDIKLTSHRSKAKRKHGGKTKSDNNQSTVLLEDSD